MKNVRAKRSQLVNKVVKMVKKMETWITPGQGDFRQLGQVRFMDIVDLQVTVDVGGRGTGVGMGSPGGKVRVIGDAIGTGGAGGVVDDGSLVFLLVALLRRKSTPEATNSVRTLGLRPVVDVTLVTCSVQLGTRFSVQ